MSRQTQIVSLVYKSDILMRKLARTEKYISPFFVLLLGLWPAYKTRFVDKSNNQYANSGREKARRTCGKW